MAQTPVLLDGIFYISTKMAQTPVLLDGIFYIYIYKDG
jgi:hypothetical protein